MRRKKLNKKGDLSTIVFISLVLTVCVFTLYILASTKTKISGEFFGIETSNTLHLEQEDLRFILREISRECVIYSYNATLNGEIFAQELENLENLEEIEFLYEKIYLEKMNECIASKARRIINGETFPFSTFVTGNQIEGGGLKEFMEGEIKDLLDSLDYRKFLVNIAQNSINVEVQKTVVSYPLRKKNNKYKILGTWESDLVTKIIPENEGLPSKKELFDLLTYCGPVENCLNERGFRYFNVTVSKIPYKNVQEIKFKTHQEYLLSILSDYANQEKDKGPNTFTPIEFTILLKNQPLEDLDKDSEN